MSVRWRAVTHQAEVTSAHRFLDVDLPASDHVQRLKQDLVDRVVVVELHEPETSSLVGAFLNHLEQKNMNWRHGKSPNEESPDAKISYSKIPL